MPIGRRKCSSGWWPELEIIILLPADWRQTAFKSSCPRSSAATTLILAVPLVAYTNQPHREFIYRQAFEMGRHIIGYEVEKVQAAVDEFEQLNRQ